MPLSYCRQGGCLDLTRKYSGMNKVIYKSFPVHPRVKDISNKILVFI